MKSKWIMIVGGTLLAALIAVGYTAWSGNEQKRQDQESLTAQRKLSGAGGQGGRAAGGPMASMMADLNLTDAQQAKMQAAQEEMRKSFEDMRKSGKTGRDQMEAMGARMQAQQQKIDAILTPEQREKMQARMRKMMGNMPAPNFGSGNGGPNGAGMPPMPMGGTPFGGGQ